MGEGREGDIGAWVERSDRSSGRMACCQEITSVFPATMAAAAAAGGGRGAAGGGGERYALRASAGWGGKRTGSGYEPLLSHKKGFNMGKTVEG